MAKKITDDTLAWKIYLGELVNRRTMEFAGVFAYPCYRNGQTIRLTLEKFDTWEEGDAFIERVEKEVGFPVRVGRLIKLRDEWRKAEQETLS